ncbi:MAG: hypothetical protein IPI01_09635 [Ignavibacteriae bacterium]|nr:hypothetical protein [Ignavibacteriota bacterium]
MPRLFIAIDTPPPVLTPMIAARNELRTVHADVRWEPDDKLHCTLKFLGDTPSEKVAPITAALHTHARNPARCHCVWSARGISGARGAAYHLGGDPGPGKGARPSGGSHRWPHRGIRIREGTAGLQSACHPRQGEGDARHTGVDWHSGNRYL